MRTGCAQPTLRQPRREDSAWSAARYPLRCKGDAWSSEGPFSSSGNLPTPLPRRHAYYGADAQVRFEFEATAEMTKPTANLATTPDPGTARRNRRYICEPRGYCGPFVNEEYFANCRRCEGRGTANCMHCGSAVEVAAELEKWEASLWRREFGFK